MIVQKKASEEGSVFFLESSEGNDKFFEGLIYDDLYGWLVPKEKSDEFENLFRHRKENLEWDNYFVKVSIKVNSGEILVTFE